MTEFADIESDLLARVSRVVWATLTTVDTKGRPRSRIVHAYWEGPDAYVFSRHPTLKEKHVAANPAGTRARSGVARTTPPSRS